MSDIIEATSSICGPHNLETESRLQMPDLQQHQGQVLNEQQRIYQRCCISHNPPIVRLSGLQHTHSIEQPVGRNEEEDQCQ